MYSYYKKEICETFSNNLPSSTSMGTLAKQLADQLSGLDPRGWFQSLTHSIGPRTIILVIVSTIIFVVYHCLHAKIVKTEQTMMVRTLLTNTINKGELSGNV